MHHSAPPFRTERATAIALPTPSFHDTMAEQLQHAPWLVLSAFGHFAVLLLLWLLLPVERAAAPTAGVAVAPEVRDVPPAPPPPVATPPVVPDQPLPTPTSELPVANDEPEASSGEADSAPAVDAGTNVLGLAPIGKPGPTGVPGRPEGRGDGPRSRGPARPQIDRALVWLARHQDESGRWDCDGFMKHDVDGVPCDGAGSPVHDVGVTGLALLAMLGDGNTLRTGSYRDNVRRAVNWLRREQQENGCFGPTSASDFVYDHAIAAYAMCEAYGLSRYETLRSPAQAGLDYLTRHRNPYGAWRYQPRDGDADTSVTGWCVLALCSGKHFGLEVDANALKAAGVFLASCTSADGHLGYRRVGEPSARKVGDHATRFPPQRVEALTAVGLFCRIFLGQDPAEHGELRSAAERLRRCPPKWDERDGSIDFYYWYYGTYALFQVGGTAWRDWSKALADAVVKTQRRGGNEDGSWDPIDAWGEDGGRVYSTALLALTLQAHYRYGRLVR